MSKNIRVIKRSQRDAQDKTANAGISRVPNTDSARQAARDITGHVATWIKEFQGRRTPDPRRAFASLFAEPATSVK
ncbi:MAG TPA: hypothetical protein VJ842_11400 [Pyrinomonadaceae bacterium]|nr:hypothetical protein [Pyrinomonadaceae bacterium]